MTATARRVLLVLAGAALLGIGGCIHWIDRFHSSNNLRVAYVVRDAGEHCFSALASGFEASGWSGASAAKEGLEFTGWSKLSNMAAGKTDTPLFFGKGRALALIIAAKQYDALVRSPRGTWITYTQEIAEARSRLDVAILAVESEDVPRSEKIQREAQELIAPIAKIMLEAKTRAADGEAQENVTPPPAAEPSWLTHARATGLSVPTNPTEADIDRLRRSATKNNVTTGVDKDGTLHTFEQLVYSGDTCLYLQDGHLDLRPNQQAR